MRKLYKSQDNKVVMGVMGGLADYFDTDATFLRIIAVLFILLTGIFPGVFIYLLAGVLLPKAYTGHSASH